jgi:hypothetical protein
MRAGSTPGLRRACRATASQFGMERHEKPHGSGTMSPAALLGATRLYELTVQKGGAGPTKAGTHVPHVAASAQRPVQGCKRKNSLKKAVRGSLSSSGKWRRGWDSNPR